MKKELFIVDDHFMLRKGIASYLEEKTLWKVSGTFSSAKDCLKELSKSGENKEKLPEIRPVKVHFVQALDSPVFRGCINPCIIVIDIQLGKESGFDLAREVKNTYPQVKIIIYSMFDTLGFKLQAKDLGVKGFISKAAGDNELINCLNIVHSDGTYFEENDISIQKELDSIIPILKENEKRVFELILQGKTNSQIKDELFLSLHTVENYVSYILNITECKNRNQLIEKFK